MFWTNLYFLFGVRYSRITFHTMTFKQNSDSPNSVVRSLDDQFLEATTTTTTTSSSSSTVGSPHPLIASKATYSNNRTDIDSHYNNTNSTPRKVNKYSTMTHTTPFLISMRHVRNLIFELCALTGSLATVMIAATPSTSKDDVCTTNQQSIGIDPVAAATTTTTSVAPSATETTTFTNECVISKESLIPILVQMLQKLMELASILSIDLGKACFAKIQLNHRKYPVALCKVCGVWFVESRCCCCTSIQITDHVYSSISPGVSSLLFFLLFVVPREYTLPSTSSSSSENKGKSGKYTDYSNATGITKTTGQSTLHDHTNMESLLTTNTTTPTAFVTTSSSNTSPNERMLWSETKSCSGTMLTSTILDEITLRIRHFAIEREWVQFHTPRNIVLALLGELGELAELVQWKDDDTTTTIAAAAVEVVARLHPQDEEKEENDAMNQLTKITMEEKPQEDGSTSSSTSILSVEEYDKLRQEMADVTIYLFRLADVFGISLAIAIDSQQL